MVQQPGETHRVEIASKPREIFRRGPRQTGRVTTILRQLVRLQRRSLWLGVAALIASTAAAQSKQSAIVAGRITDPHGAPVPGAVVRLENPDIGLARQTTSAPDGSFAFAGLPITGRYRLTVSRAGFQTFSQNDLQLHAGQAATLTVRLGLAALHSTVTVFGTATSVEGDAPRLETDLGADTLSRLPIAARKWSNLTLLDAAVHPARGTGDIFLGQTLFAVNGGSRRGTAYAIDDGTGDDSWGRQTLFTAVPLAAIEEFTVLTNAFSAEYGWTMGGAVNIVTRSGTNEVHGELLGLFRPIALEAAPPLATTHLGDRLAQGSGALGGPLWREHTYFFVSGEYSRIRRDSLITSPLAPGVYPGDARQALFLARLDHQLNPDHLLSLRLNFDRLTDNNPADAVGGLNLPSTARIFRRRTYSAQLSETATLSPHAVNQIHLQWQLGSPITQFDPLNPSPQFVFPGVATVGESRAADLQNHQYEIGDTWSWTAGRHALRLGADLVYSSSGGFGREFGGGFVLGQFRVKPGVVKPVSQLTVNDIASFTQSFGDASYNVSEALIGLFVQHDWQLHPTLTLNTGLRYDRETFTDAAKNFSPRLGLVWRLPGTAPTVLRISYGIFFNDVPANLAADYSIFGPAGIFSFTAQPGQPGFPPNLQPWTSVPQGVQLPARNITVRVGQRSFLSQFFDVARLRFYPDALLNPYTQQWTGGLEQELGAEWKLSVDYLGQHSLRLLRPVDLNAPAPFLRTQPGQVRSAAAADATRPIVPVAGGYRVIDAMVNQAVAYYDGLQIRTQRRFAGRWGVLASYTWSHTISTADPDVPGQDPNDSNFLGKAEKGPSLLDQRHRAVLTGWYEFPWRFTAGTSVSLASGRPFNITTGTDNNGDGITSDRPVLNGHLVGRNAGRGTPLYAVDLFVEKQMSLGERLRLSVRGEGYNLFNHNNLFGRNGVYGNDPSGAPLPSFGQPLPGINNTDPARQFQFQLRLDF